MGIAPGDARKSNFGGIATGTPLPRLGGGKLPPAHKVGTAHRTQPWLPGPGLPRPPGRYALHSSPASHPRLPNREASHCACGWGDIITKASSPLRISGAADSRSGKPVLERKLSKTGSLASAGRAPTVGQPPNPLATRFSAGVARNNDYRRDGYPTARSRKTVRKPQGASSRPLSPPGGRGGDSGWVRLQGRHWAKPRKTVN